MITEQQAMEIRRLASLWATARVRKNLVRVGQGAPFETAESAAKRAAQADADLWEYLQTLTEEPK